VVDLKLGSLDYRRTELSKGKAVQLAVYSEGARQAVATHPPVGYFILEEGVLLTPNQAEFGIHPSVEAVGTSGPGETFLAVEEAWKRAKTALDQRLVQARGKFLDVKLSDRTILEATGFSDADHPWANDKANCKFCDAKRLCQFSLDGGGR